MKVKVPFIMNGGDPKKFNLFNNDQLDINFKLKNISLLNSINNILLSNNNKDDLIKASETKEYYKNLENKENKKINKKNIKK